MLFDNSNDSELGNEKEQVKRSPSTASTSSTSFVSNFNMKSLISSTGPPPQSMKSEKPPTGRLTPPPGSFASILTLTKKKRSPPPPKVASNGIINPYTNVGLNNSDYSISSKGTSSVGSAGSEGSTVIDNGYNLPATVRAGYEPPPVFTNYDVDNDDDASQRTPIPTAPPTRHGDALLPSTFLRGRKKSSSNLSELSSEDDATATPSIQRHQREQENVGRLVVAAKEQHYLREAWFTAGTKANQKLLPEFTRRSKTPHNANQSLKNNVPINAPPGLKNGTIRMPKPTGPIDLDSGEPWGNEEDDATMKNTVAYTTHTGKTKKHRNRSFFVLGVPDDEDLTYYSHRKGLDRIVCTIGRTRCSLLAFTIILVGLLAVVGGAIVGVIYFVRDTGIKTDGPTTAPTISLPPTTVPTEERSKEPSRNPSPSPTNLPSSKPSPIPTIQPSPSPTHLPSFIPSLFPSHLPSSQPTISDAPSVSSPPTRPYDQTTFERIAQEIEPSRKIQDRSGQSVSLSSNGEILAVGSPFAPFGYVTTYKLVSDENLGFSWESMGQMLVGKSSEFGTSVQLSEDGMILALGDPSDSIWKGLVQVFSYVNSKNEWIQLGEDIRGEDENSSFGFAVSISGDGQRLAVGAPRYQLLELGRVDVYLYNDGNWSDPNTVPSRDFNIDGQFGTDVTLSGDGSTLACGSPNADGETGFVAIYKWNAEEDIYEFKTEINGSFGDKFGYSVSLSYEGTRLAVGSPFWRNDLFVESGRVDVFEDNDANGDVWSLLGKTIYPINDINDPIQRFGWSISLSRDGKHVAIGAYPFEGRVLIHRFTSGSWGSGVVINGERSDEIFGYDVDLALDANFLVVGAPGFSLRSGIVRAYKWKD